MVNHEMQTASIRASFGLSIDSSMPSCLTRIEGIVLSVIPIVETTTNDIDITEMIWKRKTLHKKQIRVMSTNNYNKI